MDISGTRLRAARAALFTALVVTLSAGSHVLLSRAPLPLTVVAALSVVVFLVAYAAAGRERGFWRIAALLVPLELAADTVFTSGQHVCYGPAGGPVAGSLRSVGLDVLCGGAFGTPLPGVVSPEATASTLLNSPDPALPWLLLAAHVSVGLLAAAWLRHGESALSRLVRAAGACAFRPLLIAVAAAGTVRRAVRRGPRPAARPRPSRTRLLVHSVGRRGPPRLALSSV
ncbi:hypothetical protein OIE62_12625 [Streptomyces scopuliridis]|uniref:Uncharacterized protein n=1 Tax=Streptomyces scopuliridis TaxID=452529 RepID=A0ACD4ZRE4_9ACTN|nr:hypothetical protein [Streptomyces scopuliridis]WSB36306.1 hypothetical protein OG949_28025 [Streptomyces scopuliridis]WSC00602.1 hypothetical protein OG835_28770 [Streptomyces scopuliridis]WSC05787.1 hypothetical protein OIE62_12625 [Streptomyces scopuliridis]